MKRKMKNDLFFHRLTFLFLKVGAFRALHTTFKKKRNV